jgi:hypothetical protein
MTLLVPGEVPLPERLDLVLLLLAILFCDEGDSWWHAGYETYTCSLGILHGGRN